MALQPVSHASVDLSPHSHDRRLFKLRLAVQQLLLTPCYEDPLRDLSREGVPVGPHYDDLKVRRVATVPLLLQSISIEI